MDSFADFLEELPKVELHLHLVGSASFTAAGMPVRELTSALDAAAKQALISEIDQVAAGHA